MLLNVFWLFFWWLCSVEAGKVLIMCSSVFPVHRYTMRYLAAELIQRKHEVTWFEYGLNEPEVTLPSGIKEIFHKVSLPNRKVYDLYLYRNHTTYKSIWFDDFNYDVEQTSAWLFSIDLCKQVLETKKAEFDALVAEHFDAVIVDDLYNPCGLLYVGLQKSLFIYWSLTALRTESAWANQSPSPPSYLPVPGTGLTDELNFWERSYNMASYIKALYIHQHLILRRIDSLFKKYYPDQVPDSFYIERNASLNFINTPPIFDFARPYMPRVNFVGGLHCRKPKPLNGELAAFVDAADDEHGIILFTTGFTAQWSLAPETVVNAFLSAFAEKSLIRFIWQYNGKIPKNIPPNVYMRNWLPQQDLLGHPKMKAHISHGGLNSVIESIWHGVPIIGFPLTARGYDNLLRVEARSAGFILPTKNVTKELIVAAINSIYHLKYKEEVLVFSDMLTDVPYSELNHSVFWVEFVQRHQEVPHARSGADHLNVLQYFLVDVIIFLLCMSILILIVAFYSLKMFIRLVLCLFSCVFVSLHHHSSSEKQKTE
uniref:glucuronosyltransferase n=1 Tax=Syphacia muris TaxID=451379 RepID=A0A0N5AF60_9BILA